MAMRRFPTRTRRTFTKKPRDYIWGAQSITTDFAATGSVTNTFFNADDWQPLTTTPSRDQAMHLRTILQWSLKVPDLTDDTRVAGHFRYAVIKHQFDAPLSAAWLSNAREEDVLWAGMDVFEANPGVTSNYMYMGIPRVADIKLKRKLSQEDVLSFFIQCQTFVASVGDEIRLHAITRTLVNRI